MTEVLKVIIERFSWLVGLLCSIVYGELVHGLFYAIRNNFYSGLISRRFKIFKGTIKGGTIKLSGGKYIKVGERTIIYKNCRIEAVDKHQNQKFCPELIIGNDTIIRNDGIISCFNKIIIGDNVRIAPRVFISDATHGSFSKEELENIDVIPFILQQNVADRAIISKGPIIIEDSVHIGINCVIMPGVTIGHHSIVKASSVVTKNIPPYSIVSGIPGKINVSFQS